MKMIPAIIPSYKNEDQLEKCIECLKKQTVAVEIFVRNNTHDNVYFTAAVNEGIKKYLQDDCRYMLVLNQDMYLQPDAVEVMVKFMDSHPKCGIATPLHLLKKNPDYVICAGCLEAFPEGMHQHGPLSNFMEDEQLFWGNGACMMFRKEMIQEIGFLDKNFIFIGSDSDYCYTARSRGWQVWRVAGAKGIHEPGASGITTDRKITLLKVKDMIYFSRKWLTGELYKHLSYEGKSYTSDMINSQVAQYEKIRDGLES